MAPAIVNDISSNKEILASLSIFSSFSAGPGGDGANKKLLPPSNALSMRRCSIEEKVVICVRRVADEQKTIHDDNKQGKCFCAAAVMLGLTKHDRLE